MTEKGKGSFGYLKKQAIRQGLFALGNVAICAIIFLVGFFWLTEYSTIFTVMAVLGMLPAAKFIVSMILFMKAEKFTCPEDIYKEALMITGDKKDELLCGFDFYLTSEKHNFPLCVVLVQKGVLIALTQDKKCDCNKAEEHIMEYMRKNSISGITVKVFSEKSKFFDRFGQLCNNDIQTTNNEMSAYHLIQNLSL